MADLPNLPPHIQKWLAVKYCPDCGAAPGRPHLGGCDVERCLNCEGQAIGCTCEMPTRFSVVRQTWTGVWPGVAEAIAKGYFTKWTGAGWESCNADDPRAGPDLNRYWAERLRNPGRKS